MTAEIVVMNKIAVALAADSAATVRVTRGRNSHGVKVYAANKLFRLAHALPVGVLVYGSAEFMGVPWEVLIKEYRSTLRDKCKNTLNDYADGFTAFLEKQKWLSDDDAPKLLANSEMLGYVGPFISGLAADLSGQFAAIAASANPSAAVSIEDHFKAAPATLAAYATQRIASEQARLSALPKFDGLTEPLQNQVVAEYRPDAAKLVERLVAEQAIFAMLGDHRTKVSEALTELALLPLLHQPLGELASGLVFAGFGEKDSFPSMKAVSFRGILNGLLQRKLDTQRSGAVSRKRPARVVGLAQSDMIHTFMFGADPELQQTWKTAFTSFVAGIPTFVEKAMKEAAIGSADKLAEALKGYLHEAGARMVGSLEEAQRVGHAGPFIQLVGFLSKDEMAELAESLIRLTSLKRRVTMAEETVGGPIDVAVISRGEGFVYVKRKHYFDLKLNPHYVRMFKEARNETKKPRKAPVRKRTPRRRP